MPSKSDGNQNNNKKENDGGNNLNNKITETLSSHMMAQRTASLSRKGSAHRSPGGPNSGLLNNIHSDHHHMLDPDGNGSNGSNEEDNNTSSAHAADVVSRIITFGSMPSYRENKIQELLRTTHLKDVRPTDRMMMESSPEGKNTNEERTVSILSFFSYSFDPWRFRAEFSHQLKRTETC